MGIMSPSMPKYPTTNKAKKLKAKKAFISNQSVDSNLESSYLIDVSDYADMLINTKKLIKNESKPAILEDTPLERLHKKIKNHL